MKAVFLDRDGTIVIDKNYLKDPAQLTWMPGAVQGLQLMRKKGFELFLITNQSGVSKKIFSLDELQKIHERLNQMMEEAHIGKFKAIEFCPHNPNEGCSCRKPKAGMIEKIYDQFAIDKSNSWMVGDKNIDAQCGQAAGLKPAIVGLEFKAWAQENKVSHFNDLYQFAENLK